jgi:DNA-binding FadR family transcriptional regulator
MDKVIEEHRIIVDAIRRGDASGAREAVIAHVAAVLPDIDGMRRNHPDYFI